MPAYRPLLALANLTMNVLSHLQSAFRQALADMVPDPQNYLEMIRPAQDARFGDYQANMAMSMAKSVGKPPREIAQKIVDQLDVAAFCETPEIAGPGFINLRLQTSWIADQLSTMLGDERLGVPPVESPKTYVLDYSSPNVAKPMHVGHIRSTVIGDSLARILRFVGHEVITDNHLGDWGTQFGMIIYGYKHFVNAEAYQSAPVVELGRLYRFVRKLMDYHQSKANLEPLETQIQALGQQLATQEAQTESADKATAKKLRKELGRLRDKRHETQEKLAKAQALIADIESDASLQTLASEHSDINQSVLLETAGLHAGDATNRQLWEEFLPYCRDDIQRIYQRLDILFDHELGESFYQPWLGEVVDEFKSRGLAKESEGATCLFLDHFDSPMIIQKRDGAFLYATTDLATIRYRMQHWKPDVVLYVVDHRQHEHFAKLFEAAKVWGYDSTEFRHVAFGTVMGPDGKPYKTRSGDTVGLEGLLDEAVQRAREVVDQNLEKSADLTFDENERQEISEVVGLGALKYADLSQNRASDYEFSYDKMLALKGHTAPYLLYPYARVNGIFAKGEIDAASFRKTVSQLVLSSDEERRLGLLLLRFENALVESLVDYTPNTLANYLYDLTSGFSQFYEKCKVLEAENDEARQTRLALCDLVRRTLKIGLSLLGIGVVERM
jgi:arginyl-tRNA synthetase